MLAGRVQDCTRPFFRYQMVPCAYGRVHPALLIWDLVGTVCFGISRGCRSLSIYVLILFVRGALVIGGNGGCSWLCLPLYRVCFALLTPVSSVSTLTKSQSVDKQCSMQYYLQALCMQCLPAICYTRYCPALY